MSEDRSLQDIFASLRSSSSAGRAQSFQHSFTVGQTRPGLGDTPFTPLDNHGTNSDVGTMVSSASTLPRASPPSQPSNPDRAASLLNLLKFNAGTSTSPNQSSQQLPQSQSTSTSVTRTQLPNSRPSSNSGLQGFHGRGVSASDLVASFMGKPQASTVHSSTSPTPVGESTSVTSANPQDYLLQLLNRKQSSPAARPPPQGASLENSSIDLRTPPVATEFPQQQVTSKDHNQVEALLSTATRSASKESMSLESSEPHHPEHSPEKQSQPIFTYINPFEQLAASSPRNRSSVAAPQREVQQPSRLNTASDQRKNKSKPQTPISVQQNFSNELTANGNEVLRSVESPEPPRLEDGRSKVEALIGIGAPTADTETVAQALNNVGERVSLQVDQALTRAEEVTQLGIDDEIENQGGRVDYQLIKATSEAKEKLEGPEHRGTSEIIIDKEPNEALKDVVDETAGGHGSADDEKSSGHPEDESSIPVYNFPMRPFASIELAQEEISSIQFRQNVITDIARLKKEFDQIDRTLATASGEYIMYAMPKPGGIRVIRQEDGADRQVFKETKDQVFNVAVSTAPRGKNPYDLQTCIATAVSGTVYWTALYHNGDNIDVEDMEEHCLIFPPVSTNDEHASGGQLKTRAKKSNRHPEFFAIGRGKSIQIVFPVHAMRSKFVGLKRLVNTEAYFKNRSLKINTGKAGKDFVFSEDDTVIATLDKAGRLRFWDIRELVNPINNESSPLAAIEIRSPLLTFPTSMPNEKSWPTSVLFVDKLRAYAKGVAQRYVIVGLKQNHILQLWDLGIGKVIQEVHFPHTKESDAICSVCYHPGSGIIVVGHPTRNSIYFIHLSAPKYNLPAMTQANYLRKLVDKHPSLPKPEATAIMSGMREISFASKGHLRSLDLLPMSNETAALKEEPGLFELYVMHSKGVTYLNINKSDLGWSDDNKVVDARDAEADGVIKIKDLVQPPSIPSESSSVNGDVATRQPPSAIGKDAGKKLATLVPTKAVDSLQGLLEATEAEITKSSQPSVSEKPEKRKKKKNTVASVLDDGAIPPVAPMAPPSYASAAAKSPTLSSALPVSSRESTKPSKQRSSPPRTMNLNDSLSMEAAAESINKELRKVQDVVTFEFSKTLGKELDTLYSRFQEDKRVLQAQNGAQQEAVLRLVSSSLGDNVEKSLQKIVFNTIQDSVVPAIHQVTATTLQSELPSFLSSNILKNLPNTIKQALSETVRSAIQKPDVLRTLSNELTSKLTSHIEKQFSALLESLVRPAFQELTSEAVSRMVAETEQKLSLQLERANIQQRENTTKFDQLINAVHELSITVHSIATTQLAMQNEITKLQQYRRPRFGETLSSPNYAETTLSRPIPETEISPEMRELERIKATMSEGKLEEGTIMWLQSSDQGGIFDKFFLNANPEYLQNCSPLVTLSVSAAVTATLDNNIEERLHWLDVVLSTIDPRDPEVQEVAPKIMDVLCQRLESRYMEMSEFDNRNPILRRFPALKRKARDLSTTSRA